VLVVKLCNESKGNFAIALKEVHLSESVCATLRANGMGRIYVPHGWRAGRSVFNR